MDPLGSSTIGTPLLLNRIRKAGHNLYIIMFTSRTGLGEPSNLYTDNTVTAN
jgi:hypothetical protein